MCQPFVTIVQGTARSRSAVDDAGEVAMDEGFAAGETDSHFAEERLRLAGDAADERGAEFADRHDVVPNTMGTTKITVTRDREAKEHMQLAREDRGGAHGGVTSVGEFPYVEPQQ